MWEIREVSSVSSGALEDIEMSGNIVETAVR